MTSSRRAMADRCSSNQADCADALADGEIRLLLKARMRAEHPNAREAVIVEELGLRRRQVFVDVVLVNDLLHGFEIKSDRDSLRRLARQVELYGQVLDRATLVVGRRHLDEAIEELPDWWEIVTVRGKEGNGSLATMRPGRLNEARVARSLVELLWLEDSLRLLDERGGIRGYRNKPRRVVWDRVCELYTVDEISARVCSCLKARAATGSLRRCA